MKLEDLSDAEFEEQVRQELRRHFSNIPAAEKRRLQAVFEELQQPENVIRWERVLAVMKTRLENYIGARRSDVKKLHGKIPLPEYVEKVAEFKEWHSRSLRKLADMQERHSLAKAKRDEYFGYLKLDASIVHERNALSESNIRLKEAIVEHRQRVLAQTQPTKADRDLWSLLERTG